MVIAYGGKHQPRGFVLLGANISPSNRQGHVRALSVYAAAEKKSPGTYAARSSRSGMLAINRPSVSRSIIAQ
jgi:hypothetical protein